MIPLWPSHRVVPSTKNALIQSNCSENQQKNFFRNLTVLHDFMSVKIIHANTSMGTNMLTFPCLAGIMFTIVTIV